MSLGMERALTFSYVKQLPRTTLEEVKQQEAVYDRQVLLNEPWSNYCLRIGRADRVPEEPHRDKWLTETWDEWEERKRAQPGVIDTFFSDLKRKETADAGQQKQNDEKTAEILEDMSEAEKQRKKKLLPVLHTLLLDFEEKRKTEDEEVRKQLEDEETAERNYFMKEYTLGMDLTAELWDKGIQDIELFLQEKKEAEEAAERAKEAEQSRLDAERQERETREQEEAKRAEEERIDQEKKRVQQDKDRKAAERKARVMAERDKRKSKEELAASRRDSRRRSSAKLLDQVSIKDKRREEARLLRLKRQENDMDEYLVQLRTRVDNCKTEDMLRELLGKVAPELGLLLFDCAVYIAVLDGPSLCFRYASDNCSNVLRAGKETFAIPDHPNAPTVLAIKEKETIHLKDPLKTNEEGIVRVGTKEDGGFGDFLTTPIYNSAGEVAAMLNADTVNNLNQQQTNLIESEEDCYAFDTALPAVPISPDMVTFFEAVANLLSQAYVNGMTPDVQQATSVPELFSRVTKAVSDFGPGINCYLATLTRPHGDVLTVVAQNGYTVGQEAPENFGPHNNVLTKTLSDKEAQSFNMKPAEGSYEYIENVKDAANAKCYVPEDKRNNFLYLFPVLVNFKSGLAVISVLGVEGDAQYPLKEAQIQQILDLVGQLGERRNPLLKMRMKRMYAMQCVQWCSALSGCSHVYMSLKRNVVRETKSEDMEYVAATPPQSWVVGQVLPQGEGITPSLLSGNEVKHYQDVTKEPAMKYLGDGEVNDGQLVAMPVGSLGVLFMDTVQWTQGKRNFTDADLAMVTSAASLLSTLLVEVDEGNVDEIGSEEVRLKIEDDISPSCVRFLKKVWLHTLASLNSMKKEELLEMAKYNKPPEAIPPVCAAAFIVMGKKPKVVSTWEKTRRCIKYPVLKKMAEFDPTTSKPAKAFFIRAKKMTKGLTVDYVAKKGSKPTSVFYHWTYAAVQLRYAATNLRKLQANGMLDFTEEVAEEKEETVTELNSSVGDALTEVDEDEMEEGEEGDDGEDGEEEDDS